MSRLTANSLLLIAAMVWGAAFVAQSTAMDSIGPLSFTGVRFLLAAISVAPFAYFEWRKSEKRIPLRGLLQSAFVGAIFFIAITLQQYGFFTTSVTNAGFLTALYVVFTPIMGIVILRTWPNAYIWPIVAIALIGAYLLAGRLESMAVGDLLNVLSGLFWALQIILIGRLVLQYGNPITIACLQFLTAGLLGMLFGLPIEGLALHNLTGAWFEIIYTGVFSGGLSFTLQAIGQRYTPPADAAILLSSESLFAAIFGALLLNERLTGSQVIGCAMIFSCILLVELLPLISRKLRRSGDKPQAKQPA